MVQSPCLLTQYRITILAGKPPSYPHYQGDCANLGNLLRLGECDSNRLLTNSEG